MVRRPPRARSASASATTWRISLTPASTAEKGTKRAPATWAMRNASVVLPVPGGPQRIMEWRRPSSSARRSTVPGPIRCCCPTTSSRLRGRIRSASGAGGGLSEDAGAANRSSTAGLYVAPTCVEAEGGLLEGDRKVQQGRDAGGGHDAASLELRRIRAVGDERNAARLRRGAIDPGIAYHHDVRGFWPALADDAEAVWIGLEGGDIVAGHHEIEVPEEVEAGQHEIGDHAIVVRPERRREAELPERLERLHGVGLEHGLLHRAPLVGLRN